MLVGAASLLVGVTESVSNGDKHMAVAITRAICDFAVDQILSKKEGISYAQNSAEKAED